MLLLKANCAKIATQLSEEDTEAINTALDSYQDFVVNKDDATRSAVADVLAQAESEKQEYLELINESYPELVVVKEPIKKVKKPEEPKKVDVGQVSELSVTEYGSIFKTGEPVTFAYLHNKESATELHGIPDKDSPYGRGYEPAARFVIHVKEPKTPDYGSFDTGMLTFNNPLVIDNDGLKWKKTLSDKYDGKVGKKLSKALIADGYDGVVTVVTVDNVGEKNEHVSEVVDLTTFDESKAQFERGKEKAPALGTNEVKTITSTLQDSVGATIQVVDTESSLPKEIIAQAKKEGAEGEVRAVHWKGDIFIVADRMRNRVDIEAALLHEGAHFQGDNYFGKDKGIAYQSLWMKIGGVSGMKKLAKASGFSMDSYFKTADDLLKKGATGSRERAVYLVDEFLAHTKQQQAYESLPDRIKRAIKEFIGKIRDLLRKSGFVELPKANDADISYLLKTMNSAVRGKPKGGVFNKAPAFMIMPKGDIDSFKYLENEINNLASVIETRRWTPTISASYPDQQDRLYIDTSKHNGGKDWNGGVGYRGMYINLITGKLHLGDVAGARTRKWLANDVEKIKKLAKEYISNRAMFQRFYHGSDSVFDKFDMTFSEENYSDSASKIAIFLSSDKDGVGFYGDNKYEVEIKKGRHIKITDDDISKYTNNWLDELEETNPDEAERQRETKEYQNSREINKGLELALVDAKNSGYKYASYEEEYYGEKIIAVFDDSIIEITAINGKPVTKEESEEDLPEFLKRQSGDGRTDEELLKAAGDNIPEMLKPQSGTGEDPMFSRAEEPTGGNLTPENKKRISKARKSINRWFKRNLTKEGLMNKATFEIKLKSDALKNVGEEEIAYFVHTFEKAVYLGYNKRYNSMTSSELKEITNYLKGNKDINIPQGVKESADLMRDHLDMMSGKMLEAINDLLSLKVGRLSEKQRAQYNLALATNGEQGKIPESVVGALQLMQTVSNNMGSYMTRSYQAFDDKNWKDKALKDVDLIAEAESFVRENNQDLTDGEVTGAVRGILQDAKDSGNFMSLIAKGSKVGSKDVSITKKRKDVPDVIRRLLGEYQDPKVNFTKSASKMQWYVANHHFLMNLREKGLDSFLFEKRTDEFDSEIIAKGSEAMNPLDGMFTTEDFRLGMEDILNKWDGSELMRDLIRINSMVKYGKAQPLDATVYTPNGPVKMGDIRPGDEVCSVSSRTKVVDIFPQGDMDIYQFTFADGAKTEATGNHLWNVIGPFGRPKFTGTFTTDEILAWPEKVLRDCSIPLGVAEFDDREVAVDPYLIGALIGDGSFRGTNTIKFSTGDKQMIELLEKTLPDDCEINQPESFAACDYTIKKKIFDRKPTSLYHSIVDMGLWGKLSYEKHIPDAYKYNSKEVRIAVVQGLLDTDGWVVRDGQPCFCSTSERLRDDFAEIVESLGGSVIKRVKKATTGRESYEAKMRVADAEAWFRLDRKKAVTSKKIKPVRRTFRTIEYAGTKPCQCILVEDPSHLYLTDRFIVTHNTILSPTTQMRNFQSAAFFSIMNGHFNWMHAGKAFKVAKADLFTHDKAWKDYINDLIGLGVLHDNPYAGELRDAINDVTELDVYRKGPMQYGRKFLNWMQRAYQVGDDFWKVIGFENELKSYLDNGWVLKDAREKAAYRIRNGYPTYSMVPRGVKKLRRWPLIGTFVSFPYEIIRTAYNQAGFIKEDFAEDNKSAAIKRIIGMAIASSGFYAASQLSMALMGMDDDDNEAVRAQLPEWSRNSQLYYIGYDEDGLPIYFDLSYLDPYTYIKKPISALLSGNNEGFDKKVLDALTEMAEPFIGTDIAAGTLLEVWSNKKGKGGKVYNPEDTGPRIAKDITNHIRKGLQPGLFSNIERTVLALQGETTRSGKQYKVVDEALGWVGFRVGTLNLNQSMIYKGYGFIDTKRLASNILSRTVGSQARVSEEEITDSFNAMMNARNKAYKDMIKLVAGAKSLGVSDSDIRKSLSSSNISNKDINSLIRGNIPRWRMSPLFIKNARDMAIVSTPSQERKSEIRGEMNERRQIVRSLANEYDYE